jgi:hypothetical protein
MPATEEADIRRIKVRGHARQKVSETLFSTNKMDMMVYPIHTRYANFHK